MRHKCALYTVQSIGRLMSQPYALWRRMRPIECMCIVQCVLGRISNWLHRVGWGPWLCVNWLDVVVPYLKYCIVTSYGCSLIKRYCIVTQNETNWVPGHWTRMYWWQAVVRLSLLKLGAGCAHHTYTINWAKQSGGENMKVWWKSTPRQSHLLAVISPLIQGAALCNVHKCMCIVQSIGRLWLWLQPHQKGSELCCRRRLIQCEVCFGSCGCTLIKKVLHCDTESDRLSACALN